MKPIALSLICLISTLFGEGRDTWVGRKKYEIIEIKNNNDTLIITANSDFAYYPFGVAKSITDFTEKMKLLGLVKIDSTKTKDTDTKYIGHPRMKHR
jgi:hypothetical protein